MFEGKNGKNWKFPKYLGIWEIPQIPGNLENSTNTWESCKFSKYLGILEIPQIPENLGNSPNTCESMEFPEFFRESEGSLFFQS